MHINIMMSQLKISFICFSASLLLAGCYAPKKSYPAQMPTPIYASVPEVVHWGKGYSILVESQPDATCHAGLVYWDVNENWVQEERPVIQADERGICQWKWVVPEDAEVGTAGFRGYIELGDRDENIFPVSFCIK